MENSANPQLVELFVREAGRTPSYGVLAEADREAFEQVLGELGRTGLEEQLRILSEADGRLYQREESLRRDAARRAQMIRTLGVTGGAANIFSNRWMTAAMPAKCLARPAFNRLPARLAR